MTVGATLVVARGRGQAPPLQSLQISLDNLSQVIIIVFVFFVFNLEPFNS